MSQSEYYDGTKLLSMKDINGKTPEIYLCTTNRTGGKTTYFNRYMVNSFKKEKGKFMLIYRYKYELDAVADKFFKCIGELFFTEEVMQTERKAQGTYIELFLSPKTNDKKMVSCGYAVALNSADQIKKYSHTFSDVNRMLFDEFQSETNSYCDREIEKLLSIHTSVARGNGEQVRYVPLYMCGNPVSIINPYYVELGISSRLTNETKFLRGDGFVLEQGFNENASNAQLESGFNRAFATNKYVEYSSQNVYLNDCQAFIEKPAGKSRYIGTLKYENKEYGLREFRDEGIIYCDDRPDKTHLNKLAVTTNDHNVNYIMLKTNDLFISNMRYFFDKGCFRFKDLKCKEVILKTLSY